MWVLFYLTWPCLHSEVYAGVKGWVAVTELLKFVVIVQVHYTPLVQFLPQLWDTSLLLCNFYLLYMALGSLIGICSLCGLLHLLDECFTIDTRSERNLYCSVFKATEAKSIGTGKICGCWTVSLLIVSSLIGKFRYGFWYTENHPYKSLLLRCLPLEEVTISQTLLKLTKQVYSKIFLLILLVTCI